MKKLNSYIIDNKTFKNLRKSTENKLRTLTLNPESGMNEELNIKDSDVSMVLFRYGSNKTIIAWTLTDSRQKCQIFVGEKYRNLKLDNNMSIAECIVSELYKINSFNGYYVHDEKSANFWNKMKNKYFDSIDLEVCDYY